MHDKFGTNQNIMGCNYKSTIKTDALVLLFIVQLQ